MSKFCTTCGAQLDDNATFCTSCGATQGEQPKQESAAASADDTVKNTFSDIKDKVDVGAIKDSLTIDNIKSLKSNQTRTLSLHFHASVLLRSSLSSLSSALFSAADTRSLSTTCSTLWKTATESLL